MDRSLNIQEKYSLIPQFSKITWWNLHRCVYTSSRIECRRKERNDKRNNHGDNKSIHDYKTKHRVKRSSSVPLEKYWPPIFSEQTIHAPTIYFWKPRGRINHLFFFKSIPLASRLLFSFCLQRFSKYFSGWVIFIQFIPRTRETILHSSFPCFLVQGILEARMQHGTKGERDGEVFCWNNHPC